MAEVVLFHHAQGLTVGVAAFADELREAGHIVHTPDLYEGRTFATLDEGVTHARSVGFQTVLDRGVAAVEELPAEVVYAGFSMGVMPAQKLAQTRAGARGAVLMYSALPAAEFGSWPAGVGLQIHGMEGDDWFQEDLEAARELVASVPGAELFLYPGTAHLFADSSLSDYDAGAARVLTARVLEFIAHSR